MPRFTVRAAMTREGYRAFLRHHRRHVLRGQYALNNMCAAMLLIGAVFFATRGEWGYFALFLAVDALYYGLCRAWEERSAQKAVADAPTGSTVYRFFEDRVEAGEGALRYADAWGVAWDKRAIYLYKDKFTAYILPRDGVEGGTDRELCEFLATKVKMRGRDRG